MKFNIWLRLLGAGTLLFSAMGHAADFRFAVNAPRGPLEAQKWEPLTQYLSQAVGKTVQLVPLPPAKIDDAVERGEVDFALVNPVSAVIVLEKGGAKSLATMSAKGTPQFAGVIISRKGSGITKSADLKGKNVLAYQFGTSAGAWVFQTYHVMQKGVNPSDFGSFVESKKQDDIPLAVKSGIADVGFVRTGVLEAMQKEGKLSVNDFTIVDERKGELPFVYSTVPYPEWFMVASKKTPDDVADKVKAAILALKPSDEAAKAASIDGFVKPISLDGLKAALKALKVVPYAN